MYANIIKEKKREQTFTLLSHSPRNQYFEYSKHTLSVIS
jgi:hypothetical protein